MINKFYNFIIIIIVVVAGGFQMTSFVLKIKCRIVSVDNTHLSNLLEISGNVVYLYAIVYKNTPLHHTNYSTH